MAFTVEDFEDLQRLLATHPEWRAQLRPLILGDEFLQVPERLNRIDERLEELATLTTRIATAIEQMVDRQNRMEGRMGNIEGDLLEAKYERNMREWFSDYLWPIERVVSGDLALLRAGHTSRQKS